MAKPATFDGYSDEYTRDCERVLVTFGAISALNIPHSSIVFDLRTRFAQAGETEGYRKDGPVAVAKFELGEGDEPEQREVRALRQREASDVVERLLAQIG